VKCKHKSETVVVSLTGSKYIYSYNQYAFFAFNTDNFLLAKPLKNYPLIPQKEQGLDVKLKFVYALIRINSDEN